MADIIQFVNEIFKDFEQFSGDLEKDQMLPDKDALIEVCTRSEGEVVVYQNTAFPII